MALTFLSSSPAAGATGVLLNPPISIVFNTSLKESSITKASVFVRDVVTSAVVDSTPSLDPTDSTTILLTLNAVLKQYSSYELVLLGADDDSDRALQNESSDKLASTVTIRFTTGDKLYTHDQLLEQKVSGDYTREGDLFLPSNVKLVSEELRVIKTDPEAYSNDQDYHYISIYFNQPLSGYDAEINFYPLLDIDSYVAYSGSFLSEAFTAPTGSFYIDSGDSSILHWSGEPGYQNLYIEVTIGTGTCSTDGDYYPGSTFGFNSELYPAIGGIFSLRREIPAVCSEVRNDYLGFLLFRNAIYVWEKTGRGFDLDNFPFAAVAYVINQSIVDVIEDKDLEKSLVAGTRRQLGDMNVSIDNLVGRNALKYTRAVKAAEVALASLRKDPMIRRASIGDAEFVGQGARMWWGAVGKYRYPSDAARQNNQPAANTSRQRQAKVAPYPWYYM